MEQAAALFPLAKPSIRQARIRRKQPQPRKKSQSKLGQASLHSCGLHSRSRLPESLRKHKVFGTCVLGITVDKEGLVRDVHVTRWSDKRLDQNAF